jgi:hypothetical protein
MKDVGAVSQTIRSRNGPYIKIVSILIILSCKALEIRLN